MTQRSKRNGIIRRGYLYYANLDAVGCSEQVY